MAKPLDLTPAEHRLFLCLRTYKPFKAQINVSAAARCMGVSRQAAHALLNSAMKRNRLTTKIGIYRRWARAGSYAQHINTRGRVFEAGGIHQRTDRS